MRALSMLVGCAVAVTCLACGGKNRSATSECEQIKAKVAAKGGNTTKADDAVFTELCVTKLNQKERACLLAATERRAFHACLADANPEARAFLRKHKQARVNEARDALRKISEGAQQYYQKDAR